MTAPARRSNTRAVLAAALAGLAIGALVFFLSRGDDAGGNRGAGAPLVPSSLPSTQPSASPGLPPESAAEPGGRYYAVFLAVAADAHDPKLDEAQNRARELGYAGGIGELGCTAGAREQLKVPADATTAYSIFFDSQQRADLFVRAYGAPVVGTALISAGCLD
jgi:hypothetical protein